VQDVPRSDPDPVVEAYKKDIDRTLIRENLKLTVEERFRKAMALARFAEELRRAGKAARSSSAHDGSATALPGLFRRSQ
jgi:hypothetical protein